MAIPIGSEGSAWYRGVPPRIHVWIRTRMAIIPDYPLLAPDRTGYARVSLPYWVGTVVADLDG